MKTQKASDSFIWAGFIAFWFVMSPALMSQLHLGLISHVLQDLSRKAFPKRLKTVMQQLNSYKASIFIFSKENVSGICLS